VGLGLFVSSGRGTATAQGCVAGVDVGGDVDVDMDVGIGVGTGVGVDVDVDVDGDGDGDLARTDGLGKRGSEVMVMGFSRLQ
jgi:hypothetical protein